MQDIHHLDSNYWKIVLTQLTLANAILSVKVIVNDWMVFLLLHRGWVDIVPAVGVVAVVVVY